MQAELAERFPIRPHWGKAILRGKIFGALDRSALNELEELRATLGGSRLRPNTGTLGAKISGGL